MKKIVTLAFVFSFFISFSQSKKVAEKYFQDFNYLKSAEAYEKIYNKGEKTFLVISRIADSYYLNALTRKSEYWYEKLFAEIPLEEIPRDYYFKYAHSLKSNGNYEKSDEWLLKFRAKSNEDSRGVEIETNEDYLADFTKEREKIITLTNLPINTAYSDFSISSSTNNKVIFASSRPNDLNKDILYEWNNQPFLDLYIGSKVFERNEEGDEIISVFVRNITPINSLNTELHEGSAATTKDGNIIYFTRVNYLNRVLKDDEGIVNLKLYKAEKIDGEWKNIRELPFNSDDYSVGHPALSPDEKYLYFVSDMPGSIGETDIYKVSIKANDTFGEPENLGSGVNTEGKEMFPFVSSDSTLYFSSNGHLGLGLLDIFSSKNDYSTSENLGTPFNSPKDDFAFSIDLENNYGFLSSNREGGKGDDDIYAFTIREPVSSCQHEIVGVVTDMETGNILPNTAVTLYDAEGNQISQLMVGVEAKFSFNVECNTEYKLLASRELYESFENTIVIKDQNGSTNMDIELKLYDEFVAFGEKILIKVNPIYFDFDKYDIRPDAAEELDKLVAIMKKHPKFIVEAGSHTDRRSTDAYNDSLSNLRAKSTVDYIVSKGISKDRISAKGYGEKRPVNDCVDGVWCEEKDHQLNRRTDFVVTNYNAGVSKEAFETTVETKKSKKKEMSLVDNNSVYVVQSQDTFFSISMHFGVSIAELKALNGLTSDDLKIGQRLKIKENEYLLNNSTYTVAEGDTLFSIARKVGVSITKLKELNDLKTNKVILGQELRIK